MEEEEFNKLVKCQYCSKEISHYMKSIHELQCKLERMKEALKTKEEENKTVLQEENDDLSLVKDLRHKLKLQEKNIQANDLNHSSNKEADVYEREETIHLTKIVDEESQLNDINKEMPHNLQRNPTLKNNPRESHVEEISVINKNDDDVSESDKEVNDSIVLDSKRLCFNDIAMNSNPVNSQCIKTSSNNPSKPNDKLNEFLNEKFLQKIHEQSEEINKEVNQALDEIQAIEAKLSIDQRLLHDKWQIRKNAYKEIAELCDIKDKSEGEMSQIYDTCNPWMKYFVSDSNLISLHEGLCTFKFFNENFSTYRHKGLTEFLDELEKIVLYGKFNLNDISFKIIFVFLQTKKLFTVTLGEILKRLSHKNNKMVQFMQKVLLHLINNNNPSISLNANIIKLILEKAILSYMQNNTNGEKKKIYSKLIMEIFMIVEDDLEIIKGRIVNTGGNFKDIEKILNTVPSKDVTKTKYQLYPMNNMNSTQLLEKSRHNAAEDQTSLSVDLYSLLPQSFNDIPYMTNHKTKLEIMKELNNSLGKVTEVKDKEKDYKDILSILNYTIDDSNILVHSEGITSLTYLCRLLGNRVNLSKLKVLLYSCFDKFKDKKTLVKNDLYSLFNCITENGCMNVDVFYNFIFQFVSSQKIPIIKQGLLEYIRQSLGDLDKLGITEECCLTFTKFLCDIIHNESLSSVKDVCTDIILLLKPKMKNPQLNKLIINLPAYRRTIINSGKNDYNSNETSERDYKAKIKRVKSSLSFSTSRASTSVDAKDKILKRMNTSMSKKNEEKRSTSNIKTIKVSKDEDGRLNKGISKLEEKKRLDLVHKAKAMDTSTTARQNEANAEESKPNPNLDLVETKVDMNTSMQSIVTNKSLLEQRKDSVIEHILSLSIPNLIEFTKNIITDFLKFVNNVTSGKMKENLYSHFEVIIAILEKILDRIVNKINPDVLKRIIKVIVVAPSVLQPNEVMETILPFIHRIRNITEDDEFYQMLHHNVIQYLNKGGGFLDNVDVKASFVFFIEYTISEFEDKSKELKDLIITSPLLDEKERTTYLSRISHDNDNSMITFDMEDHIENNHDERKTDILNKKEINNPSPSKDDFRTVPSKTFEHNEVNDIQASKENHKEELKQIDESKIDTVLLQKYKETERILQEKLQENEKLKEKLKEVQPKSNTINENLNNISLNESDIDKSISKIKNSLIVEDDISKIKEQITNKTKKLDMTLKRLESKIEKHRTEEVIIDREKPIRSLEDFYEEEKNKYEQELERKHPNQTETIPLQGLNEILSKDPLHKEEDFTSLILKIPSTLLDNNVGNVSLYIRLENSFKLLTSENKLVYISKLKQVIDNFPMIQRTSFNCYLQLVDYVICLLCSEIVLNQKLIKEESNQCKEIIIRLQEIVECLLTRRESSTECVKILIYLLRKYMPRDLKAFIDIENIVILKILSYLLKTVNKSNLNGVEIIKDINALFLNNPPSSLQKGVLNFQLYHNIYNLIKLLTDEILKNDKKEIQSFIEKISTGEISVNKCEEYFHYMKIVLES